MELFPTLTDYPPEVDALPGSSPRRPSKGIRSSFVPHPTIVISILRRARQIVCHEVRETVSQQRSPCPNKL